MTCFARTSHGCPFVAQETQVASYVSLAAAAPSNLGSDRPSQPSVSTIKPAWSRTGPRGSSQTCATSCQNLQLPSEQAAVVRWLQRSGVHESSDVQSMQALKLTTTHPAAYALISPCSHCDSVPVASDNGVRRQSWPRRAGAAGKRPVSAVLNP